MRTGRFLSLLHVPFPHFLLVALILLASLTALATRTPDAAPQTPCPSQADCDRLKAISDLSASEAAAAKAAADQAEADRAKDLATADRLERDASHPDPGMYPRASDRVGYGQAMRAQAQGLRDKLANAKATADAKAKTAADAAKAYQDCLDRMKACAPKETTPQTPPAAMLPQIGRLARRTGQPTACVDGTTTSTALQYKINPDYLRDNWNGKNFYWELQKNYIDKGISQPPPKPLRDFGNGWVFDPNSWTIRPKQFPLTGGQPVYIPPPCYLNGTGILTLDGGIRYNSGGLSPYTGYFPLNPGLLPPLNFTPTVPEIPVIPDEPVIPRIRTVYLRQPLKYYIRPKEYYDYRSQYFWFYDLFGIPYKCSFDFPNTLRDFAEIKHALAVEEASRRRRDGSPTPERANAQLQLASFRPSSSLSAPIGHASPAPQNGATNGNAANTSFTYSIVSNGKSTGEAFQLQLLDPTGQVKSVRMRSGAVLEAIAPGVTQPVAATAAGSKVVTQPMNGYCLEFGKHPPAEGTLYRLADESTQQKYRPMRFISRAAEQMEQKKAFHPDSDPKAYMDAIVQYALWSKLEGWSQEQFTQHFVERTKENADALHVKWTKEMENALRAAAPGRWKDISEMLSEAQDLEKNSGQGRGGRRGGGGRGERRGAARGD